MSKHNEKLDPIGNLLQELGLRPIAYFEAFARLTGGVNGGVLLSQLVYWNRIMDREFYKSDAELMAETGLTRNKLRSAKRACGKVPGIRIVRKSMPCRTFYRIERTAFLKHLRSCTETIQQAVSCTESGEQVVRNPEGKLSGIQPTTSETTSRLPDTTPPPNGKSRFGDFVLLTEDEHRKLIERFGKQGAAERVENMNERIGAKGYRYKSHYHALLSWERSNGKKSQGTGQSNRNQAAGSGRQRASRTVRREPLPTADGDPDAIDMQG